jgi:acetolactate synthase-1/2/3 large subunit
MNRTEWIDKCNHWKNKWPVIQQEYLQAGDEINMYAVIDAINKYSKPTATVMADAGSGYYIGSTAFKPKQGQRFVCSVSQADMGWAVPAAVGVALASKQQAITFLGDGSFMSNIQELAVAKQHNLDIKFVILNNNGYSCIRNTQTKYYQGRVYGTSNTTGIWFPSFENVSTTFGLGYKEINDVDQLKEFEHILNTPGPMLVVCKCNTDQEIAPAQGLKNGKQAGLHDLFPFLSDEELNREMIVKYNV